MAFKIEKGDVGLVPFIVKELSGEMDSEYFEYNENDLSKSIMDVVRSGGQFWVAWDEDEFVGICLGMIYPSIFNHGQMIAECIFTDVMPKYNKSRCKFNLREKFESWAKENEASLILYGSHDPKDIKSLKRKGFKRVEIKLIKRVDNGI
jgi:hypothetical protein